MKVLGRLWPGHGFVESGLVTLYKSLGFYPGAIYYDFTQADLYPGRTCQFIVGPAGSLLLNGNRDHLLRFNLTYPLFLDRMNVVDYARFFFAHINGPHGRTVVVDTVEDLNLREEPSPGLRKSLGDRIIPLGLNASLRDGGYQLRGTLLIGAALYCATLDINMVGDISGEPTRLLADLLPISDQVLEG